MAESTRPAGGTLVKNPSDHSDDDPPVAWVSGQGYDRAVSDDRSSEGTYGSFDDIYNSQRDSAGSREEAKAETRERNRGRSGDGNVA